MIRSRIPALVAVALWLPSATALGEDRAAARRHFAEGERAYAAEDWPTALAAYEAAYAAAPLPALMYNIAQCQRKLGNWEEARDAYRQFLDSDPDPEVRAVAEDLLREVTARIPERPPVEVPPTRPISRPELDPAPPPADGPSIRWPTWAAAGAGVLLAGVAVAFAIDLGNAQSDLDDPSLDCGLDLDRCLDLRDRGRASATWRTVFATGSALTLAVAALLLTLDLSRDPERESTRLAREVAAGEPRLAGTRLELAW